MISIDALIGILGLCLTSFGLGYKLGRDSKAQK